MNMTNGWSKQYKVKIVIEQIEFDKETKTRVNSPSIFHKFVTVNDEGKERFFGPDKAMMLGIAFLFDKLQGFTK